MKSISVKSYAKINIGLNVVGKDEEGFHLLDMIMVPLELHDSILIHNLTKAPDNYVTIDDFSIGQINHNLSTFAIEKLSEQFKFDQKFRVFIHKNIPLKAGLGGGSSNGAATMLGVSKLIKLNLSNEDMLPVARNLGCDVPFFLYNKPMRCRGRGDILDPINIKNNYHVLLVKPKEGCSTSEVYEKSDSKKPKLCNIDKIITALENGDDETLANEIGNSLEETAIELVPEIQIIKDKLKAEGLKIVLMSGSGSTVFALSTDKKLIKRIAIKYEDEYTVEVTKILK